MSFDLASLKSDMTSKGYNVSSGANWLASDQKEFLDYTYFEYTDIRREVAPYGLAYPGVLPSGFPGTESQTDKPVESIAVDPTTATLSLAGTTTQQLAVTATRDDGSTDDVSATATYSSSDETKATVDATGLVTAVAAGNATITATYKTKTATCDVTVTA